MRILASRRGWLVLAGLVSCSHPDTRALSARELDGFDPGTPWQVTASDGVVANVRAVPGVAGNGLQLDFDFQGHGGHAGVRRSLPIDLPENYELSLSIAGDAPPNDLQIKLLDESGDNVWWYRVRDATFSRDWRRLSFKKRQVEFAWGPTQQHELAHVAAIELVVAAGTGGGRGSISFDRLTLEALPSPPTTPPVPTATASSSLPAQPPALALDAHLDTAWQSAGSSAEVQHFELDLGYEREFGGLILRWAPGAEASRYAVELSRDRASWRVARRVRDGNGGVDALLLPESEARYIRLRLEGGPGPSYGLREVEVKDLAFGATPNAFVSALAREAPRGRYPRAFVGEQAYWTLVGVDGGVESALLSEDGALEVARGGYSIEPFVLEDGKLFSWADVDIEHSLRDGYLPIPSVTWRQPQWALQVTSFAFGDAKRPNLGARYELRNLSPNPLSLQLVLAARPLQVNPPTQWLNLAGGVSPIRELRWDGRALQVNRTSTLLPLAPPDQVALSAFDAAEFPVQPSRAGGRAPQALVDATGMASALLVYSVQLPARESLTLGLVAPLTASPDAPETGAASATELRKTEDTVASDWKEKLERVRFEVPAAAQPLVDTLRSCLAQILMSRDGPVLRPGTRSYARSWIRDGAMMSESLLRLGHAGIAADYFEWFASHQFDNGKVPCCVDARGADPVPEHDSPGEFIFLAAELYRFTGDRGRLERAWPHVEAAAGYLEGLRQEGRRTAPATPEQRAVYGLLPPSISHEGYSDKPAYSYWDDFWALIGYQDAAWIAEVLGRQEALLRLVPQRDGLRQDLYASLQASAALHGVPFLPGAADRGDFDPTATTIALAPGREGPFLPRQQLTSTFERYWQDFNARRSSSRWDAYTPYELRIAGSFIRLGWRERAHELFDFFLSHRRPAAWNQWAEVVGRQERQARFVGDMPHAWIASDYIRSALDVFVYAREADKTLVLAAGVPPGWFDLPGVAIHDLRTPYGQLDYSVQQTGSRLVLEVTGASPPGGCIFPWPWDGTPARARVTVNGKTARFEGNELGISNLPSRIVIERR